MFPACGLQDVYGSCSTSLSQTDKAQGNGTAGSGRFVGFRFIVSVPVPGTVWSPSPPRLLADRSAVRAGQEQTCKESLAAHSKP